MKKINVQKNELKSEKLNAILELFYENPGKKFSVREIERLTKIPKASVHNYLIILKRQGMVTKDNKAESNLFFKTKKTNYFTEKIIKCGLVDELIKNLNPSCIILFGSIRKGDSEKGSDIDIFVESFVNKDIHLRKYERKLKHKIQFFIESDINKLNNNLFNNVINGIKIFGGLKLK